MKRKLSAILLAGLVAVGATACSSGFGTSAPQPTESTASAPSGQEIELEFFALKPECVTVMDEIIAAFNEENPGIRVFQTAVADPNAVLLTRISSDDMPDLLNTSPAEDKFKVMFDAGMMTDLTDQAFMSNVEDAMLNMSAYNGRQYALPMTLSSYGIYYRTDIFADNNIAEPATYEELIDACKTLHAAGIDAFALPNKDVSNCAQRMERLIGVLNNNSHEEFQKIKAGEQALEDSVTIRTFAEMCVEIAQYSTADSLGLDYEGAVADLVNGKAAMMISGAWMLSTMQQSNPDIQIKLIPFPSPLGDEPKVPVNIDTAFSLSADCAYQEAGLKFIEYMSRTETAQKYYEVDGNVNMIKGVVFDKTQHLMMKDLMDQGKMFLTQVNFWPNGLREEMRPAAQRLFVDSNVDDFVTAFGDAIDKLY